MLIIQLLLGLRRLQSKPILGVMTSVAKEILESIDTNECQKHKTHGDTLKIGLCFLFVCSMDIVIIDAKLDARVKSNR